MSCVSWSDHTHEKILSHDDTTSRSTSPSTTTSSYSGAGRFRAVVTPLGETVRPAVTADGQFHLKFSQNQKRFSDALLFTVHRFCELSKQKGATVQNPVALVAELSSPHGPLAGGGDSAALSGGGSSGNDTSPMTNLAFRKVLELLLALEKEQFSAWLSGAVIEAMQARPLGSVLEKVFVQLLANKTTDAVRILLQVRDQANSYDRLVSIIAALGGGVCQRDLLGEQVGR